MHAYICKYVTQQQYQLQQYGPLQGSPHMLLCCCPLVGLLPLTEVCMAALCAHQYGCRCCLALPWLHVIPSACNNTPDASPVSTVLLPQHLRPQPAPPLLLPCSSPAPPHAMPLPSPVC
jgi:hypothetical protein